MPAADQTGYILVVLASKDDDTPVRDPAEVAQQIAEMRIQGVCEVETLFSDGFGRYVRYGDSYIV